MAKGAPAGNGHNGGGGGAAAPGAPVNIPDIIQSEGVAVADVINSLETGAPLPGEGNGYNGIIAQCGGTLCVSVKTKVDPAADKQSSLSLCVASGGTEPPAGTVVPRGGTIYVLTGGLKCEPAGSGNSQPPENPPSP